MVGWLQADQPLTARVTVNRYWQEVFGTGIVRTSGDFGVAGELPTHPELLDWLAVEFREGGWDVKASSSNSLVSSAAYRRAAAATTKEKLDLDPQNRLASRAARASAWMPNCSATMPWRRAGCSFARPAARA